MSGLGLRRPDLGRNYHRLEQIGDAGIEQDLASALRVVEIGKQAETEMRREPAHGVRALGRRERHLAHAVHVNASQMEGEKAALGWDP